MSNTPEFEEACWEAIRHLEDENTDLFLLATSDLEGETNVQFAHNQCADEDDLVNMLTAFFIGLGSQTEQPLDYFIDQARERAFEIGGEM